MEKVPMKYTDWKKFTKTGLTADQRKQLQIYGILFTPKDAKIFVDGLNKDIRKHLTEKFNDFLKEIVIEP